MREVIFYRTSSGRCPVEEFLDRLPAQQARKVVWVLRVIEDLDSVPAQYLKKLKGTEGIWEVRAEHGGQAFRLLGFFPGGRLFVLTSAFAKKTESLPKKESALAEARRRDYLRRHKHHE